MMKRLLAILLIGLLVSLAPQPAQAQGSCPNATIEHYGEGSSYALRMSSDTPVSLTSVTLNWYTQDILMTLFVYPNNSSQPLDGDGSYTFDPDFTLDSNGIFILYGFSNYMDVEAFTYSCTTEVIPTPTPEPTGTPEVFNAWGRAITNTGIVDDFNTTMAAANGGTPIDMTPYELPTPSLSLPALTIDVADMNIMGKTATTVWAMIDQYDILPFYFLIAIGLAAVWWLYRFITDLPTPTPDIDLTGAMDAYAGYDDWQSDQLIGEERRIQGEIDDSGDINTGWGRAMYDDSTDRLDALNDRKARNADRRQAVRQGVSLTRRLRKLF